MKAVLTTEDSGGVLELVNDRVNGLVVAPDPIALADAMDRLFLDRISTANMGNANKRRLSDLRIDWETVVSSLTL